MVGGRRRRGDGAGVVVPVPSRAVALRLLYVNFFGNASVPLYRLDAVRRVGGYDPGLLAQRDAQGCEDWDLSLRIAARYTAGVAPGYHVGYRQGMGRCRATWVDGPVVLRRRGRARAEWKGVPPAAYRWSEANFAQYLAADLQRGPVRRRHPLDGARAPSDPAVALSPYTPRMLARSAALFVGGDRSTGSHDRGRTEGTYSLDEIKGSGPGAEPYAMAALGGGVQPPPDPPLAPADGPATSGPPRPPLRVRPRRWPSC